MVGGRIALFSVVIASESLLAVSCGGSGATGGSLDDGSADSSTVDSSMPSVGTADALSQVAESSAPDALEADALGVVDVSTLESSAMDVLTVDASAMDAVTVDASPMDAMTVDASATDVATVADAAIDEGSTPDAVPPDAATGTTAVPLLPDANGFLGSSSNPIGIQGPWYAFSDGWGTNGAPPGVCETVGGHPASACSTITFPPAASPSDAGDGGLTSTFPQSTPGTMCLSGTATQVIAADYTDMFGIGIGLDFNNTGGVKMPYDATAHKVTGFSFTVSGIPTGGTVRVELPIPATDATSDAWSLTLAVDGSYTVDLSTATTDPHHLTPAFAPTGTQPAFDASQVESIQFHVPTTPVAPIVVPAASPLCVSNLRAIVSP
jgi:hypothetical protein